MNERRTRIPDWLSNLIPHSAPGWRVVTLLCTAMACLTVVFVTWRLSGDQRDLYSEVALRRGMSDDKITEQLGLPDKMTRKEHVGPEVNPEYEDAAKSLPPNAADDSTLDRFARTVVHTHVRETWFYGPLWIYRPSNGHKATYRLTLTLEDGELIDWERTAPGPLDVQQ